MLNKRKITLFYGTRPEFIKLIPLIRVLQNNHSNDIDCTVVSTGQHKQLLEPIEKEFKIKPHANLAFLQQAPTLESTVSFGIQAISNYFKEKSTDVAIGVGDTTTGLVTALGSFLNKIPFVHIEAGMRSHSKYSPFPEEIFRKIMTPLASLHLCPSSIEYNNLLKENVKKDLVYITGNTVIDTLLTALKKPYPIERYLAKIIKKSDRNKKIILVTQHRRENFGKNHTEIFLAIKNILRMHPDYIGILPVHYNPAVRSLAHTIFQSTPSMYITEPLSYFPFAHLMAKSKLIITDSGGLQEEAPSLGIPVLVTRTTTERPLTISSGKGFLVGTDENEILKRFIQIKSKWDYQNTQNPYGDGKAAQKCAEIILTQYEKYKHS
jgi:UDP-N-acetylglucosamine 2-epimerase (non-hydrolysing)